jgi:predicted transcriptional regulator of viral defense system
MAITRDVTTNNIVARLLERGIYAVTPRQLAGLFALPAARAYYLIQELEQRGWIVRIEKGKYVVVGFEPQRVLTSPFYVACSLVTPSYISFISALHRFRLTEQVPFTVLVATTVKHKAVTFDHYTFQYVRFKPHKFFGYSREMDGDLPVLIAHPEKAVVDSLDQIRYRYGGGIDDMAKALYRGAQDGTIDLPRLVDYALQMRNKSVCARLGYLARVVAISSPDIERLKEALPRGFVPLDPTRPHTSEWNAEWKININMSRDELLAFREGVR